jgi:hypothetical protein
MTHADPLGRTSEPAPSEPVPVPAVLPLASPPRVTTAAAIALQRAIGNRAFAALIASRPARPRLLRAWIPSGKPPIERWDVGLNGRIWHFDPETNEYFYTRDPNFTVTEILPEDSDEAETATKVRLPEGEDMDWLADLKTFAGKRREASRWGDWLPQQLHRTVVLSPVTDTNLAACIKGIFTNDPGLLRAPLKNMLKAKAPADGKPLTELATTVHKRTKELLDYFGWRLGKSDKEIKYSASPAKYVRTDPSGDNAASTAGAIAPFEAELKRAIYNNIGNYMESEEGFDETSGFSTRAPEKALGVQAEAVNRGGLWLHFTTRTDEKDRSVVNGAFTILDKLMGITAKEMADDLLKHIGGDMSEALTALASTTSGTLPDRELVENLSKEAQKHQNLEQLVSYWDAVIKAWKRAMSAGTIHLVLDHSGIKDAFGYSSENKATPATLMEGKDEVFKRGQRIVINLDSALPEDIVVTIAHELAHAIGFNPTGHDPHGHFSDIRRYKAAEATYGSNLLFDAYYFETLVKRLGKRLEKKD